MNVPLDHVKKSIRCTFTFSLLVAQMASYLHVLLLCMTSALWYPDSLQNPSLLYTTGHSTICAFPNRKLVSASRDTGRMTPPGDGAVARLYI